jgi:hypothetical protein
MSTTSSLYVANNRTLLTQNFLEKSKAEWLLQIDTDVAFPPTILETMVKLAGSDKKILAASVPLGITYESCGFKMEPGKVGIWRPFLAIPQEPVKVVGIATACVLIHREVFETMAERHGQSWWHHMYLDNSPEGTPMAKRKFISEGEDFAFSLRARDAGFDIWCVHVPGIRHFKTEQLSHDFGPTGSQRASRSDPSAPSVAGKLVTEA